MSNSDRNLIWAVLVAAQFLYLAVVSLGIFQNQPSDSDFLRLMSVALGIVCLAEVAIIVFVFRRYVILPVQTGAVDLATPPGAKRVLVPLVVCWAIAEATAIHGFVLALLAGSSIACMLPFLAVSLTLMWFTRPWSPSLRPAASSAELARSNRPLG